MGIAENLEIGRLGPERMAQFALDCFGGFDIDQKGVAMMDAARFARG
jgi:hypothetical protein